MRAISALLAVLCLFSSASVRLEAGPAPAAVSLSEVMAIAQEKNPDILAARQSWKVSRALIGPAKAWPNPIFTYEDEKLPGGMEGVPSEEIKHYRLEQMVPFPGKLSTDA